MSAASTQPLELETTAAMDRQDSRDLEAIRELLSGGCDQCARRRAALARGDAVPDTAPHVSDWIVPERTASPGAKRAGVLADYEIVCGAGDYELDVIVREIEVPKRLDIGGQVTRAMALHDPARDVPLYLVEARGADIVSVTRTDDFGEFDFEAAGGSRYGLRVGDRCDAPCVLVWDGAA